MTMQSLERFVASRDAQAFGELVRNYQDLVYGTCRRILGSSVEVEDAVQETFFKFAQKAGEIRSSPGAWLHACARSTAMNMSISHNTRKQREAAYGKEESSAVSQLVDEDCERAENSSIIDSCLDELPETDREVVIAYFFAQDTQDEIAKRYGVSRVAIGQRLDRVLAVLRQKFVGRGLIVSGLMATFLRDLSAASRIPYDLSHTLSAMIPETSKSSALLAVPVGTMKLPPVLLALAAICAAGGVFLYRQFSSDSREGIGYPNISGFEVPRLGTRDANGDEVGDWHCSEQSGISGAGGDLSKLRPRAPEGDQVAFVRSNGLMLKKTAWETGSFTLSFWAVQANDGNTGSQKIRILIDSKAVGDFEPGLGEFRKYSTAAFSIEKSGPHAISLVGLSPESVGSIAFIDAITVDRSR